LQASEVPRAVAAAVSIASALDLTVDDAVVLHNSNRLAVRLLPCDVLARIAPLANQVARFEVELAQRLAETESPVAALEPRAEPRAQLSVPWTDELSDARIDAEVQARGLSCRDAHRLREILAVVDASPLQFNAVCAW
jgi:hypothetical protein